MPASFLTFGFRLSLTWSYANRLTRGAKEDKIVHTGGGLKNGRAHTVILKGDLVYETDRVK